MAFTRQQTHIRCETNGDNFGQKYLWRRTDELQVVNRARHLPIRVELHRLSFAFVINRVEPHHRLEERMKREIRIRVNRHLKQWREYVVDHVGENAHLRARGPCFAHHALH